METWKPACPPPPQTNENLRYNSKHSRVKTRDELPLGVSGLRCVKSLYWNIVSAATQAKNHLVSEPSFHLASSQHVIRARQYSKVYHDFSFKLIRLIESPAYWEQRHSEWVSGLRISLAVAHSMTNSLRLIKLTLDAVSSRRSVSGSTWSRPALKGRAMNESSPPTPTTPAIESPAGVSCLGTDGKGAKTSCVKGRVGLLLDVNRRHSMPPFQIRVDFNSTRNCDHCGKRDGRGEGLAKSHTEISECLQKHGFQWVLL